MGRDLQQTIDGGYIIGGMTTSNDGDVTGYHSLYDVWVVKLLAPANILPVELLHFTGEERDDQTHLSWHTTNEIDNAYFSIQRSESLQDFQTIGKIEAVNENKEINKYSFIDKYPYHGINYYWLKQSDDNGYYTYSDVIAVNNALVNNLTIFPNPSSDVIYINAELFT